MMELTSQEEISNSTSACNSTVTSMRTSTGTILSSSETASSRETLVDDTINFEPSQFDNESTNQITMVDAMMQFPFDVAQEIFLEHSYCSHIIEEQTAPVNNSVCESEDTTKDVAQSSSNEKVPDELFSSPPSSPEPDNDKNDPDYVESSQSSQTSTAPSENIESVDTASPNRILLVYEEKLHELMKFCPKCGSPVNADEIEERGNEGSQYSVKLNCLSGCNFTWQAQPSIPGIKGEGNLALSAGIFFSGIQFSKFQQFSSANNLKSIGEDCYYNLREKHVFPVIDTRWEREQSRVINTLKDRVEPVTLAGDGRCDSPGHSAKYGTYTMLDVSTNQVVDFKVVSVCEVKNSNTMEKKGFIDTLNNIEEAGVCVAGVSTDSHPQIKKYMREEQKDKKHHIDPWHAIKNVTKKLWASSKKKGGVKN